MRELGTRVALVLVQPENPLNVGSVIRVMDNFGLQDLRLVEPAAFDPEQTASVPGKARDLARSVRRFTDLNSALADCGFVLAATRRRHSIQREPMDPDAAAVRVLAESNPGSPPAAILFGCESAGLPRAAVARAHGILTIPTATANPSLNLAQAVAITSYALFRARAKAGAGPPAAGGLPPADGAELDALFARVDALVAILRPRAAPAALRQDGERLRSVLLGGAPRHGEAAFLGRLLEQIAQRLAARS